MIMHVLPRNIAVYNNLFLMWLTSELSQDTNQGSLHLGSAIEGGAQSYLHAANERGHRIRATVYVSTVNEGEKQSPFSNDESSVTTHGLGAALRAQWGCISMGADRVRHACPPGPPGRVSVRSLKPSLRHKTNCTQSHCTLSPTGCMGGILFPGIEFKYFSLKRSWSTLFLYSM